MLIPLVTRLIMHTAYILQKLHTAYAGQWWTEFSQNKRAVLQTLQAKRQFQDIVQIFINHVKYLKKIRFQKKKYVFSWWRLKPSGSGGGVGADFVHGPQSANAWHRAKFSTFRKLVVQTSFDNHTIEFYISTDMILIHLPDRHVGKIILVLHNEYMQK